MATSKNEKPARKGLLKRLLESDLIRPLPGSGIISAASKLISKIKEPGQKATAMGAMQFVAYVSIAVGMWYLIIKGCEAQDQLFNLLKELLPFLQ